jgi:LPS export ABC transporter protein LptC
VWVNARHIVGAFMAVAGMAACGGRSGNPSAPHNPLADSADQVVFGARSKMTDGGVSKSDLYSDTAYFFDDNTRIEMRGHVLVTFFTDVGAKNAVLTSKEGTYNNRTGNMEARGNVIVNTVDGRHLTTSILKFNQAKNEISSDSSFVTTDSARRLIGIGFTSDPNMTNIHCFRACSGIGGQVALPGNQPGAQPGAPVTSTPAGQPVTTAPAGQYPTAPPPPPPPPQIPASAGTSAPPPAKPDSARPAVKPDSTRRDSTKRDSTKRDSATAHTTPKPPMR